MNFFIASTERGDPQTSQAGDEVQSCLWGGWYIRVFIGLKNCDLDTGSSRPWPEQTKF